MGLDHSGELAALGTAACWVVTSLAFAQAGQRIGSFAVNLIRLFMALPFLALVSKWQTGAWVPCGAGDAAWGWLSLSGLVGFVFGDMCLFRAFVLIGPRLSSLIMATSPLMTALMGYLILGEGLSWTAAAGMSLTIGGVSWAVAERPAGQQERETHYLQGVILALGGALGQAAGLVLSKLGMGEMNAFAATEIRVIAAIGGWLLVFLATHKWSAALLGLGDGRAMGAVALGAIFGPMLGVGLSLYAVQHAHTGVAAAIMSTTPILLIPISVLFYRERIGLGGVLGTFFAVGGVALLFQV